MTKATASVATETVVIKKTIEEKRCTLNISMDEAETLMAILESVGGSSTISRRKHADSMEKALEKAGIDSSEALKAFESGHTNSLYFKDEHEKSWE
jgi:hypothetical protein